MSGERDGDATEVDEGSGADNRPSGKRSSRLNERRAGRATAETSAGGVGTLNRPRQSKAVSSEGKKRGNPVKALIKFFREVVAELRKVIWPNRKEMITYTSVVLVFVIFMVALISGLDLGFIKGVSWLFG